MTSRFMAMKVIIVMEVLTLIRHSLTPDDQNPIYKYFKVGKQIGSSGPEMAWRIFQATRIDDGKDAAVFIFEKKTAEKLYKPRRREIVTEMLRKDARLLSELRHPKILRVLRPLEESHDSIAFATEPVIGSLSNLLGNYDRMPNNEHNFLEVEIKYGIMQIAEALSYLHTTEHILHNNVCPENVLITKRGMWRLSGFGFSECSKDGQFKVGVWILMPQVRVRRSSRRWPSLIWISSLRRSNFKLPNSLPVAATYSRSFFDDPMVRCIQALDAADGGRDLSHNFDLFNKISQVIPHCPKKLQYGTFFPFLKEQMLKPEMLTLVLPCVVVLIEHSTTADYHQVIMPELKKVFSTPNRPVQATVFLLEKLNVLLAKASEEDIKSDVLPLVFSTIESNSIPGQEAAINVFNTIKKYLDDQSMRKLVLPKAMGLFVKSSSVRTKLNALACIDRLLDSIYKHLLTDRMFGLTHSLIATKIMPTLIPYTVCPGLNLEQFSELMEVLFEMLAIIDTQRRTKMINEAPDIKALEMRRTSMDMRFNNNINIGNNINCHTNNNLSLDRLLGVESCIRASSAPGSSRELSTIAMTSSSALKPTSSSLLANQPSCRRHSSYQALLNPNSQSLEEPTSVKSQRSMLGSLPCHFSRQASIPATGSPTPNTPSILVSKPSVNDFKEILSAANTGFWGGGGGVGGGGGMFFLGANNNPEDKNRRASTHSMGVIEPIRRNSREILDRIPIANRRPSFHGMCETAMQFFSGK
ncbi:hypothetical protein HELRODRAFT_190932 [Helobdella robusta]|uniref:Protein kinase domain-containing protein n=1 Tax=Helobdella robusta TaxID=6412 RepID=T1FSF7_HELRO|nr:hypothetical protein HELRODRAFT_190932 [Helobdella robusta]ESO08192.1 hypothetical protein HELRODRAFT_190932 [Helobdella robusta]